MPPQPSPVRVGVTTDKPTYNAGEPVRITVSVTNPTGDPQTLTFTSSLQADYVIDDTYRWSAGRAFLTVMTAVRLGPKETRVFPEFTHLPSDYFLAPGRRHEIRAELGRYGAGSTVIAVDDSVPPPQKLLISPTLTPNPVNFGSPVDLAVTITNTSSDVVSFEHDGCPVIFTVDRIYTPHAACAMYNQQVTLQPGASIRFGSDEYPYLVLKPYADGFVLRTGKHEISFTVRGVGSTSAILEVVDDGNTGAITGSVYAPDGTEVAGARVQAFSATRTDTTSDPATGLPFVYETVTDRGGAYRLDRLPPDSYVLRAFGANGTEVWYNQVRSREEATPVAVAAGQVIDGINFMLDLAPPPPPPPQFFFTGRVFEAFVRTSNVPPPPIPGAVVAAMLISPGPVDTGWVPPGDSTGVRRSGSPPAPPDSTPPWPVPPMPPIYRQQIFYGITDTAGVYWIDVPAGQYKLIAFTGVHRYQWWNHVDTFVEAEVVWPDNPLSERPTLAKDFHLALLPHGVRDPLISGFVRRSAPIDSIWPPLPGRPGTGIGPATGPPIARARIEIRPLVADPRIMTFAEVVYPGETDSTGAYVVSVPPTVPYKVKALARGYQEQVYDHVPFDWLATPVDVAPGVDTENVNFDLQPSFVPIERGTIAGYVRSYDPRLDEARPDLGLPVAGAWVRIQPAVSNQLARGMVVRTNREGFFEAHGLPMAADGSLTYYVSAAAEGHLPAYYSGVYFWKNALPVAPSPPGTLAPIYLHLQVQVQRGPYFVVGLVRGTVPMIDVPPIEPPLPGGGTGGGSGGAGGSGGRDSTAFGAAWSLAAKLLAAAAADSDSLVLGPPLPGAFMYLVPADPEPTAAGTIDGANPVAGAVAYGNGTLLIGDLPAGRYRAYADCPGFQTGWFHGTGPLDAAVITIGPGIDPMLVYITLEPVGGTPGTGGGEQNPRDLRSHTVLNLRNSPNPFKPETTIMYRLAMATDVSLHIFDVRGRLVRTLFDRIGQPAGEQRVPWDGRDDNGKAAGAGIYFYRVTTVEEKLTGKMVMVK